MNKTYDQYIKELEHVYNEFYCHGGKCPNFSACSNNMEKPKFKCEYATRVSKNYGQGVYPKVVVLGQESKEGHEKLVPPASKLKHDPSKPDEDYAHNVHYLKTLYTLAMVLKGEQPEDNNLESLEKYEGLLTQFCLTNYFKCSFSDDSNKVHHLNHSKAMKENCYKLLLKELCVLEPDLLVVQGKFTTKHFWTALDNAFEKGIRVWGNKDEKNDNISLYKHALNGKPFYILYSYHPCSKQWNSTKKDLKTAIDKFREKYKENQKI